MNAVPMQKQFDIFISYKHRRFYNAAKILADLLNELQIRTWVDQKEIEQNKRLPLEKLKTKIKTAVLNSKLVVFYETYDAIEMNPSSGLSVISFNWQIFERQYAEEILFVIPKSSGLSYILSPDGDERLYYYNIPYLAYLLAITIDADFDKIDDYWNKYFSMTPNSTAQAFQIYRFHDLPESLELPGIIDPKNSLTRENIVQERSLRNRKDVSDDNLFLIER